MTQFSELNCIFVSGVADTPPYHTAMSKNILLWRALRSRCGHYIFALWFLLSSFFYLFYSSPNLSRRRLDVYYTSTYGVALVRI